MKLSERFTVLFRDPQTPHFVLREAAMDEWGCDVATAHVLCGESGEYSGRETWVAAAYLCPEQARAALHALAAWCESTGGRVLWDGADSVRLGWYRGDVTTPTACPHDSRFQTQSDSEPVGGQWRYFDSATYTVEAIPLRLGAA